MDSTSFPNIMDTSKNIYIHSSKNARDNQNKSGKKYQKKKENIYQILCVSYTYKNTKSTTQSNSNWKVYGVKGNKLTLIGKRDNLEADLSDSKPNNKISYKKKKIVLNSPKDLKDTKINSIVSKLLTDNNLHKEDFLNKNQMHKIIFFVTKISFTQYI